MQSAGWQGGRESQGRIDLFNPARDPSVPDYPRLIEVLTNLRQCLDPQSGETILTASEAAKIRACGFAARATVWRCPLLPDDLVWYLPILSELSDRIGPELRRGTRWHPKRAAICITKPIGPLGKLDRRLILLIEKARHQRLDRRTLKRILWRRGARVIDFALDRLLSEDHITEQGGFLFPFSKAEFKASIDEQRRPRGLAPVSTVY
jgi:hypothetical protein